jgi:hypothetical protein
MERAVEFYPAIAWLVIGGSHLLRPHDWCEAFRQLHGMGRPGAFFNGGLSLFTGALILAGHGSWSWPGTIVTVFGWLLVAKSAVCLLWPEAALRSMEQGSRSPRGFVVAGIASLAFSGWLWYCLWMSREGSARG